MINQLTPQHRHKPSLPPGQRIYAIGDIHGRLDLLIRCYELIEKDHRSRHNAEPTLIHLGDYVDRGPDSKGIIDCFLDNPLPDFKKIWLKGNHEEHLLKYCKDKDYADIWFKNGAIETLKSYGVQPEPITGNQASDIDLHNKFLSALPFEHTRFFWSLETRFEVGDYFFAHAGIHPDIALIDQKDVDLMWIRTRFLQSTKDFGKIIIHGHTITEEADIQSNRIGIDTGAYYSGRLTCLALEGTEHRLLTARVNQSQMPAR